MSWPVPGDIASLRHPFADSLQAKANAARRDSPGGWWKDRSLEAAAPGFSQPDRAWVEAASPDRVMALYDALLEMYEWRYIRREVSSQEELDEARDAMYERARVALAAAHRT